MMELIEHYNHHHDINENLHAQWNLRPVEYKEQRRELWRTGVGQ